MTDAPPRSLLLKLGEDLAWPTVEIEGRTIAGADEWRWAAAMTTPPERLLWLEALSEPLLNATPPSHARLEAWRRSPVRTPGTAEWIRENVLCFGDASARDHVVAALLIVPQCVREHVMGEAAFLSVGGDSDAWTGSSRFVDRDGKGRPRIIVLSSRASGLVRLVLHEIAHSWSLPTPTMLISVKGEEGLRTYAKQEGLTEQVNEKVARDERLAHALALLWEVQAVQ